MKERTTPEGATYRKRYHGKHYTCAARYVKDVFGRDTTEILDPGCGRSFIYSGGCPYCSNRLS